MAKKSEQNEEMAAEEAGVASAVGESVDDEAEIDPQFSAGLPMARNAKATKQIVKSSKDEIKLAYGVPHEGAFRPKTRHTLPSGTIVVNA